MSPPRSHGHTHGLFFWTWQVLRRGGVSGAKYSGNALGDPPGLAFLPEADFATFASFA